MQSLTDSQCLLDESLIPHVPTRVSRAGPRTFQGLDLSCLTLFCRVIPAIQALRVVMGNRGAIQTKDIREATLAMRKDLPRAATRVTRCAMYCTQ